MRIPKDKKYCSSLEEADQYLDSVKFVPCPHCRQTGYLIGHGFLKGYREHGHEKETRGRRFFCSNRHNRRGCGRTCPLLLSSLMLGFSIGTGLLWKFMRLVLSGKSRKASWEALNSGLPVENGYRLWQKLRKGEGRLRTYLCRKGSPPVCNADDSLSRLAAHMSSAFSSSECPLSAFQEYFQTPLFI